MKIETADISHEHVPGWCAKAVMLAGLGPAIQWSGDLGKFTNGRFMGMIGTREPQPSSSRIMAEIAIELAARKAIIVSGGARGTDLVCHLAALKSEGRTIVCVPGGLQRLDREYWRPELMEYHGSENLLFLSVFPPDQEVNRQTPVIRNRLIAALSEALTVGEASPESGSFHCVYQARKSATPIFFFEQENADERLKLIHKDLLRRGAKSFTRCDLELLIALHKASADYRNEIKEIEKAQLDLFPAE